MVTVTLTLDNLKLIYSQLNHLRNYIGLSSLDPMEHVIYMPSTVIIDNYF